MATVIQVKEAREPILDVIDQTGSRSYHVYFDVADDVNGTKNYLDMINKAARAVDPQSGLSIPQKAQDFDGNKPTTTGEAIVRNITCELFNEQNLIWEVNVRFAPADDVTKDKFPWQEPRVYDWGSSTATIPTESDARGKAIENSAGDPFSDVTNITVAVQTLTLTYNAKVGQWDPDTAKGLMNTVNSGGFHIGSGHVSAGTGLLTAYNGKLASTTVNDVTVEYWQVTASWKIDVDDVGLWELEKLDIGWEAENDQGVKAAILDENGVKYSAPQPLDGRGKRAVAAGKSVIGAGKLLEFRMYTRKSHSRID